MTANDYMHMCRDFQTAFKTCIALSTYIKLLGGGKTKLTSIHPEDLPDSLGLGLCPSSQTGCGLSCSRSQEYELPHQECLQCNNVKNNIWETSATKPIAPNYHLPTRCCSIKGKWREGNGAMLQHKPCKSTFFWSKKGTIQQSHNF